MAILDPPSSILDLLFGQRQGARMKQLRRDHRPRADTLRVAVAEKFIEHMQVCLHAIGPRVFLKNGALLCEMMVRPGFHEAGKDCPPAPRPAFRVAIEAKQL